MYGKMAATRTGSGLEKSHDNIKLNKYYLYNVVKKAIKSITVDNFIFTFFVLVISSAETDR